jgi:hypothetical protein
MLRATSEEASERSSLLNIKLLEIPMSLQTLISKLDAIENSPRISVFEGIGQGDVYFRTWETEIHPTLCEVALQPDQIQQLFKSIETGAGRSMLGKAGDAIKGAGNKISDVWFNKFGGMLQSSGPVQAFDQKWEDIKSSVANKNPELAAKLAKYGEFAKNNPNLHKFLLAIAGSAAAALGVAVAGGVGAGALAVGTGTGVAVGILNIADRLLQGQKASTAIGRGATVGAVAGLTAAALSKIKDMFGAFTGTKIVSNKVITADGRTFYLNPEDGEKYKEYARAFADSLRQPIDMSSAQAMFSNPAKDAALHGMDSILQAASDPTYQEAAMQAAGQVIEPTSAQAAVNAARSMLSKVSPVVSAIAGQAAGRAGEKPAPTTESLNRNQLNELFGITGNKVDASRLQKAWKKAGSPTDSDQVATILTSAGVDPAVISKAYTDMSIPVPTDRIEPTVSPTDSGSTGNTVNINDLLAQILKLDTAAQQEILSLLKA